MTVSRRGVCFFRNQDITGQQMTELGRKIGQLSGHPDSSSLHVHPLSEEVPELGGGVIAEISSEKQAKGGGLKQIHDDKSNFATTAWQ
jgi:alpha-ketoglutarate-dependent taurine dioxygenase